MSVKNKVKRCNKEIKRLQEELEMYKDFKEIANTKIGDANPLKVLEVNKILDRQCKRQQIILNKVTEECRKQMTEYEDSILEIFPQKLLNIIEEEN